MVDQQIGAAVPSNLGVGGALKPRSYTQNFTEGGDGANYDLGFSVS